MIENQIVYKKDGLYSNHGDFFDFKINDKTIDIKTAHFKFKDFGTLTSVNISSHYYFLIAEHQIDKKIDCYVNIQVDAKKEYAYFTGFILKDVIKKYEIIFTDAMKGGGVAIPLSDLKDMKHFIDYLNYKLDMWM